MFLIFSIITERYKSVLLFIHKILFINHSLDSTGIKALECGLLHKSSREEGLSIPLLTYRRQFVLCFYSTQIIPKC